MLMKEVQSYGKFPKRHELFVQTKKKQNVRVLERRAMRSWLQ